MLRKWTNKDVIDAEKFYETHNAGFLPYPWPKELFQEIVDDNDGYFPVTIEALPEGTCANIHVPVFVITAEGFHSFILIFEIYFYKTDFIIIHRYIFLAIRR